MASPNSSRDSFNKRRSISFRNVPRTISAGGSVESVPSEHFVTKLSSNSFPPRSESFVILEGSSEFTSLRLIDLPFNCSCGESKPCHYNPHNHRKPKMPISVSSGYFNLLRTTFGAGILAMPLAISHIGIISGPILVLLTGLLLIHTHKLMLDANYEVCRLLHIPWVPYRYGFKLALQHGPFICQYISPFGSKLITFFTLCGQFGICAVYLIFCADCVRDSFDLKNSREALTYLYLPMCFLVQFMKNLTIISHVSIVGNVCMVLGVICTLIEIISPPHYDEIAYATWIPIHYMESLGVLMFNLSAVAVVNSIDQSLPDPTHLTNRAGILNVGILTHSVYGAIFGVMGYAKFGEMDENVIRSLPFDDSVAIAALLLYGIAVFLTYPIQSYPGIDLLMDMYKVVTQNKIPYCTIFTTEILMRFFFVTFTFVIVTLAPYQSPVVCFVGSLCTAQLALVFPAMMQLSLEYRRNLRKPGDKRKYKISLAKNMALIVGGLFISAFGGSFSTFLIYVRVTTKESIPLAYERASFLPKN